MVEGDENSRLGMANKPAVIGSPDANFPPSISLADFEAQISLHI